jgi:phosphatidylinositol glycan class M
LAHSRWTRSFGGPFLQETFLYHLSRLDHRHNFSAYFYPYYLSLAPLPRPTSSPLQLLARHPLAAFLPQLVLSLGLGLLFGAQDLPYAWLVQTFAFVALNKVCTSQVRIFRSFRCT